MSIRLKLLLPGLIAFAAALAWALWPGAAAPSPQWLVLAAAGLIAAQAVAHERWVINVWRALRAALGAPSRDALPNRSDAEWHDLLEHIAHLRDASQQERAAREQALSASREVGDALRLSEQRYALAVRGANDGMWEWDLKRDRLMFSPRWQHMFGLDAAADQMSIDQWRERLHPDDREAAIQALRAHLDGRTDRYEHPHRLLHADGRYRWVLSRGAAVRRASGNPYRVLGLDTDITRLKQVESLVVAIADGIAAKAGAPFYEALVMHFARALQVDCAFITECTDRPATRARTLAFWRCGAFDANFEYELVGTPCEYVFREGRTCFYPSGLGRMFPCEAGEEGYLGLPIFARDGFVIGHLAFVHGEPLHDEILLESVYRIFTARAGVEIELGQALALLEESHRSSADRPVATS